MHKPPDNIRNEANSDRFDAGRHWRAKIGFVLLAMEQTVEADMFRLAPPGVGVHFSRAPMANRVSVESFEQMVSGISGAAALILPDENLDVICYACTSGSVVIGEDRVFNELRRGKPAAQPTALITCVMQALETIGAKKIAVATPYIREVNDIEQNYMEQRGFSVVNMEGLNIDNDSDMARLSPDYLFDFAVHVDRPDSDAIFISCSALRSLDIIAKLESKIGKPVITSNQAMAWHCLRLAGVTDKIPGYGRLLQEF